MLVLLTYNSHNSHWECCLFAPLLIYESLGVLSVCNADLWVTGSAVCTIADLWVTGSAVCLHHCWSMSHWECCLFAPLLIYESLGVLSVCTIADLWVTGSAACLHHCWSMSHWECCLFNDGNTHQPMLPYVVHWLVCTQPNTQALPDKI